MRFRGGGVASDGLGTKFVPAIFFWGGGVCVIVDGGGECAIVGGGGEAAVGGCMQSTQPLYGLWTVFYVYQKKTTQYSA